MAVVRWNAFEKYYVLKVRKRIKWVYSKLNIFCARFMYVHAHCSACLDKISIHNKYFIYIICLNGWRRSQIYVPWTSLEKFQFFLVSIHFLCRGSTYWYSNEIWYTDLSYLYLGQVWFWLRSSISNRVLPLGIPGKFFKFICTFHSFSSQRSPREGGA